MSIHIMFIQYHLAEQVYSFGMFSLNNVMNECLYIFIYGVSLNKCLGFQYTGEQVSIFYVFGLMNECPFCVCFTGRWFRWVLI